MATLGALLSQQLGFTVTTTAGTIYTHGLGFTPTLVLLTPFVIPHTGTVPLQYCYSLANSATITIIASYSQGANLATVDVLCGAIHTLIR